jgi:hypothetical protein
MVKELEKIKKMIAEWVHEKKDWETRHTITPFYQNVTREGIQF